MDETEKNKKKDELKTFTVEALYEYTITYEIKAKSLKSAQIILKRQFNKYGDIDEANGLENVGEQLGELKDYFIKDDDDD